MEKLKKIGRSLARDHLPLLDRAPLFGALGGTLGSAILRGSLSLGSAIGGILAVVSIAAMTWGVKYRKACKKQEIRLDIVDHGMNGYAIKKLEGPGSAMHTITQAEKLVKKLVKKYDDQPQLPAKVQKKIDAHIADAQEAATRVRLLIGDEEQKELPILRTVFNIAAGTTVDVQVATIAMLHTPTPDEIAAAALAAEKAKVAQGQAAAAGIHAGSSEKLTVKPIKLKQPKMKARG
jgi:hypothetical protein